MVILGGLVIGNILAPNANTLLTIFGFTAYVGFAFLSIYFKKKGE